MADSYMEAALMAAIANIHPPQPPPSSQSCDRSKSARRSAYLEEIAAQGPPHQPPLQEWHITQRAAKNQRVAPLKRKAGMARRGIDKLGIDESSLQRIIGGREFNAQVWLWPSRSTSFGALRVYIYICMHALRSAGGCPELISPETVPKRRQLAELFGIGSVGLLDQLLISVSSLGIDSAYIVSKLDNDPALGVLYIACFGECLLTCACPGLVVAVARAIAIKPSVK
ncbi:hypothetical protein MBM_04218 [Drepanopeziza brunnea f. sp. 'multigermtubi' MB_m1]|uniref:Uncharacterized protein n=1 Tax=Marssonina brunnea f. sp. multigermtubi (strain MB_m1) TaxID=1072389 RepID=K1WXS2_MARBU|nr:uncharacterized protein MBM_04218 [Drepanopeziza brunnea f. sp. 'multigermtubi' MB_m1]EKD17357.1 hypothetical protein MBM_04218 [Drepanopeziza brunnea f. sp. 'multigermtubi' MB_m1]